MRGVPMFAALAAVVAAVPELGAQEPRRRAPEPLVMEFDGPGHDGLMKIVMSRRARLGITVAFRERDSDSLGAYVEAVTPGGPAAQAGLRAGDVITKLDGKPLVEGRAPRDDEASAPGVRLVELVARLEPSDTVRLEYLRDSQRRTVAVVAEEDPNILVGRPNAFSFRMGPEGLGPMDRGDRLERMPFPGTRFDFRYNALLGDLELAPLNDELGQYFGTNDGVLVISAGRDSRLDLKGGDVILSVDGRRPSSPGHLMRILGSYEPGEKVKLEIMRNKRRETVTAELPERTARPRRAAGRSS